MNPNEIRDRLLNEPEQPLFDTATFDCFLNRASLRFLRDGELSVAFLIPAGDVDSALALRYLAANPLPLTVTVRVSQAFLDDKAETEKRLRAL